MPPLITVLIVGAGAYLSYRWISKQGSRVAQDLNKARDELKRRASGKPPIKDLGALKRDPKTGDYKPDRDGGA